MEEALSGGQVLVLQPLPAALCARDSSGESWFLFFSPGRPAGGGAEREWPRNPRVHALHRGRKRAFIQRVLRAGGRPECAPRLPLISLRGASGPMSQVETEAQRNWVAIPGPPSSSAAQLESETGSLVPGPSALGRAALHVA